MLLLSTCIQTHTCFCNYLAQGTHYHIHDVPFTRVNLPIPHLKQLSTAITTLNLETKFTRDTKQLTSLSPYTFQGTNASLDHQSFHRWRLFQSNSILIILSMLSIKITIHIYPNISLNGQRDSHPEQVRYVQMISSANNSNG